MAVEHSTAPTHTEIETETLPNVALSIHQLLHCASRCHVSCGSWEKQSSEIWQDIAPACGNVRLQIFRTWNASNTNVHNRRTHLALRFPLLAVGTGARRTEIAQLKMGGSPTGVGIYFIDFNEWGRPKPKNLSSARSIAVYPDLVATGFLEYCTTKGKWRRAGGR